MAASQPPSEPGQTFVFADLAGFTALTEAHGDLKAADLAEDFSARVAELAPRYGAEPIKDIGDAVLLRVAEAEKAVALGLAIVEVTSKLEGYPAVRVGMHSGTAVMRGGDWIGGAVNIAARVSGAAGGGEVVLTKATQDLAGDRLGEIDLEALGEQRFRNLPEPVRLYRARAHWAAGHRPDVDPVCRMAVAPGRGVELSFEGRSLRFCSLDCAGRYAADPEAFEPETGRD